MGRLVNKLFGQESTAFCASIIILLIFILDILESEQNLTRNGFHTKGKMSKQIIGIFGEYFPKVGGGQTDI